MLGRNKAIEAHDRTDRTTAFATHASLPLDVDDGALHRSSRHRDCPLRRNAAAGLVADCGGLGPAAYSHVQAFTGSIIGRLIVFGFTWALMHHMLSGIRHFV